MILTLLAQRAPEPVSYGLWDRFGVFFDTPAPYSPFSEYLLLLFVMWLIARRANRRTTSLDVKAQEVLDQKYADGELSRRAYEKFRQAMSLRPRR